MSFLRKFRRNSPFIKRHGSRVAVLRPLDPRKNLDATAAIERRQAKGEITPDEARRLFNQILESQPFRFVGYLSKEQTLIDEDGKYCGLLERGDSFVNAKQLAANTVAADIEV